MTVQSQIEIYDKNAARLASEYELMAPKNVYTLVLKYFAKGSRVVDVGSGSGRDVAWLLKQGYQATGVEASENMIKEAQLRHKEIQIVRDQLPELKSLKDNSTDNILLSGVLMHLQTADRQLALKNMVRILKSGGRMIVSYRKSRALGDFESDGRAFYPIDAEAIKDFMQSLKCKSLFVETGTDSTKSWTTLIFEKD